MSPKDPNLNWSRCEPEKAATKVQAYDERHEKGMGWRHRMALRGAMSYSGLGYGDLFEGLQFGDAPAGNRTRKARGRYGGWPSKTSEQHARAAAETVCEKITGLREPKTQMVATDAEWELRRQGIWADRFIEGNMHLPQGMFLDTWDVARHGFLVAAVSTGVVAARVEPDYVSKRVRTQLRSTLQTFIDPGDVANGMPLSYFDVTWENPEYLAEDDRFKNHKDAMWKAAVECPHHQRGDYANFGTKMLKLTSAWRMPFGSFKGREAVFFGGKEAPIWEPWEFPEPPLAFYRMNRCLDPSSFWGENFIEIMLDPLRDAEDVDDMIQRTMRLTSQTYIGLSGNTSVPSHIADAKDVSMFRFDPLKQESAPVFSKPGLLHADYFQYRDRKQEVARQLSGVPEMHIASASGAPNASGRSKRLEASLLPERFAKRMRNWDHWVAVDIATRQIRAARKIGKVEPNWQVTWPGADFDSKVSVKVLDIDDHIYELRPYVVGEQKNTPAALAQDAQEAFDREDISKESLSIILNGLYDVRKETNEGAETQRTLVAKVLDEMLHADESVIADENKFMAERYIPPTPWMNAAAGIAQALPVYNRALIDRVPQNRRALVRRYIEDLVALKANQDREAGLAAGKVSIAATPDQAFPGAPAPALGMPAPGALLPGGAPPGMGIQSPALPPGGPPMPMPSGMPMN